MAKSALDKIRDPSKKVKIVETLPAGIPWAPEGASMVVSTPNEVNELMQQTAFGEVQTSDDLRLRLTKKHGTDVACPMSTGIFINIAAKAAEEQLAMGAKLEEVTPYWRILKTDYRLNPKFPGGLEGHEKRLKAEGHTIRRKSKNKWIVEL